MEYTQEQVDEMIASRIAEVTKGLYSEADLQSKVTAEVDRRVESGIQNGVAKQKAKWEAEFAEKAKLSAEELAHREIESKLNDLSAKEKEIARKSNLINAKDALTNANVPKEHYDKFIDLLVSDADDVTTENVTKFISMFNETSQSIENKIKEKFSIVTPPNSGSGGEMTSEKFAKLSYSEALELKKSNPELYNKYIK